MLQDLQKQEILTQLKVLPKQLHWFLQDGQCEKQQFKLEFSLIFMYYFALQKSSVS